MADTAKTPSPPRFVVPTSILAGALVLCTFMIAGTVKEVAMSRQAITVKGYAEVKIKSDLAVWRATLQARDKDLSSAYQKLSDHLKVALDKLRVMGVEEKELEISGVSTSFIYEYSPKGEQTNKVQGYELSQNIKLVSSDIRLVRKVSRKSSALIREGIEFRSYQPEYHFTKLDDLKIELLGNATEDARKRAEQLASKSGARVGALKSASQGVFQITSAYSTEVSNMGYFDTESIDKAVKAVVTVQYFIR